jgi:trehalose/maltose transport system permease protein
VGGYQFGVSASSKDKEAAVEFTRWLLETLLGLGMALVLHGALILAGLQTIPSSLTEAAQVDGASAWHAFWHIRLPLLMPSLLIAAMLRALDAFRIFDLPYVLTGGGPADSTETLSTLAYKRMFSGLRLGPGSSITPAMFATEAIIAIGFAYFIFRRMRASED